MKLKDIIPRLKYMLGIKTGRLMDGQGNEMWFFHWKEHRDGGPAYIGVNGAQRWFQYGKLHREGDEPAVISAAGDREWWKDGKRTREGAPAIEKADGTREWWLNDQRHRADGPAIERADGTREWWKDGKAWPEGDAITPKIQQEQKEKALDKAAETATVAPEGITVSEPPRLRRPAAAPKP